MYIFFSKKHFIHLTFLGCLLVSAMAFFCFQSYNQYKIENSVHNGLYDGLVLSGISDEGQVSYINNDIVKKEPYLAIPKISTNDLYCSNLEGENCIKTHEGGLNSQVNEPFIRSLLLSKGELFARNISVKNESELCYFTKGLADVLNELENLDGTSNNSELKTSLLTEKYNGFWGFMKFVTEVMATCACIMNYSYPC